MADDRIFRVVKQGRRGEKITYHSRTSVSGMFSQTMWSDHGPQRRPDILKVEATNAEATDGWTDVTAEFRDKPARLGCDVHGTYTGVHKPYIWSWKDSMHLWRGWLRCKCPLIYAAKHPDYPAHDPLCGAQLTDPANCACRMITKFFE